MNILDCSVPHDTSNPEPHYTPCRKCGFVIKFYYAGKVQHITKEIECPICHNKKTVSL